ncbi:MAG: S-layer homology domain-containing protein, partial [Candidatus Pelagibacter ubique]
NTKGIDVSKELDKKNNLFDALNHAGNIAENSKVPTFFSYIKNDLHLETKEESDNFSAISTFTYELPNELKKLLGNSGKLCVFIDDLFIEENTAHPDVEGNYMAYGIVLIKEPKTTPKNYNLNDFNQVAEKLVDKVINGMYEDTPSAKVDKTTIRRDEYKSAIQEYLYKEYCALVEDDIHDGYLIEKGILRFDFDMKNPEVYWKKPISEELEVEDFYDYLEKKNIEDAKYICTLSDIDNHWAKNTISTLASMKAIDGYSDGTYKPNKKVTDAEFLTIFTRAIEKDKIDDCFIQQSKYDNTVPWWQAFFVAAHDVGLIDAYKHRVFMDQEMTRERMIYYICSY